MRLAWLTVVFVALVASNYAQVSGLTLDATACSPNATWTLAESIPLNFDLPWVSKLSTHQGWLDILNSAQSSIDIGAFYFSLLGGKPEQGGYMGEDIMNALVRAANRGVVITIVQQESSSKFPNHDSRWLSDNGYAKVYNISWGQLTPESDGGILHTKMIIVDQKSAYLGSANMDWTSLAQVKELGVIIKDCRAAVEDLHKIFQQYLFGARNGKIPRVWPQSFVTPYNLSNPLVVSLNRESVPLCWTSSPAFFCAENRQNDYTGIVTLIRNATKNVSISVMDYLPVSVYHGANNFYWGVIDNELRFAAFRGVNVRLMIGNWTQSTPRMWPYLRSLDVLDNIEVRLFTVNSVPDQVPFTRVNHAKYLVTEKHAFIGTSNWQPDYFLSTGGISFITSNANLRSSTQAIFDRDWNSKYATRV